MDDGCQGRARQLGAGSSLQFSEVVRKLEITLDRKMGRGAALTWSPPTQNTLAVDGLILQRSYQRGSRPCQMRFAVSLKDSPKRFKLSPVLAKIVNLRQESESKDRVVAALGRYVEQLQLRDVKDGRVHARVVIDLASANNNLVASLLQFIDCASICRRLSTVMQHSLRVSM